MMASLSIIKLFQNQVRLHGDEVTVYYDKKIPKVDPNHACLAVISLDSALKKGGNYYL